MFDTEQTYGPHTRRGYRHHADGVEAITAIGAGFLVNDLIFAPLFAAFLGLTVWPR